MSLDYSTVHFCSSLLSVSYGTMLMLLWARRRERHLLLWSLSLFLVAAAGYGFTLAESRPAIALLLGFIAFNVTLIWAGGRSFDGQRPFEWRMAILPVLVAVTHFSAASAGRPDIASALATALLGINVFVAGRYFLAGGSIAAPRFGRRIVAWALFAYIPIYILSGSLSVLMFGTDVPAVTILVGDLVLNNVFVVGLFSVIEDRTRHRLRLLADTDPLTGALNRGGLKKHADRLWPSRHPLTVLVADLDHFKQINDAWGHAAGDAVLESFVARVRALLGETAPIARLGGEEFAILLSGCDEHTATDRAEAIRLAMSVGPVPWGDAAISCTVSIGIAARQDGENLDMVQRRADEALYRAKKAGRNRTAA